jgi:hypothetical protein
VGLLPGLDREAANGWVSSRCPTGLGEARNALVVRAADAVVAIGGGWGTLSEIALALKTGVRWSAWDVGAAIGGAPVEGSCARDGPREAVDAACCRGCFHSPARDFSHVTNAC